MQTETPPETLSRDEVSDLLSVPHSTIAVWRHKEFVGRPEIQGATARQSRFTADEVFAIGCFALAARDTPMKQREASTAARYIEARDGTVETLRLYWPLPLRLTVYPSHDLAAFDVPGSLLYDLSKRASDTIMTRVEELRSQDPPPKPADIHYGLLAEYPAESLFSDIYFHQDQYMFGIDRSSVEDIRAMEQRSDPGTSKANARANTAATIFRNAKNVQYKNVPKYDSHFGGLDYADLTGLTTEQLLAAEAWALRCIDDALFYFGLGGPPHSLGSPHYTIDVSDLFTSVANIFGLPKSRRRQLLEHESFGRRL